MKFDTRTLVLVTRRLLQLSSNPPLFHELITPRTIAIRFERIRRWLGDAGCYAVGQYIRSNQIPPPDRRHWRCEKIRIKDEPRAAAPAEIVTQA